MKESTLQHRDASIGRCISENKIKCCEVVRKTCKSTKTQPLNLTLRHTNWHTYLIDKETEKTKEGSVAWSDKE